MRYCRPLSSHRQLALGLIAAISLSGCGEQGIPWTEQPDTGRWYTQTQVEQGRSLFATHCASCHGSQAEGAAQWQRPGLDGRYPPPPLNGSAHAWHHPYPMLVNTIKQGTSGNMPAWEGVLDDAQITSVIAYFQHFWPERGYQLWLERHKR